VLAGTWLGDQAGQPGRGTAERTYQFILNDRFLQETNTSTCPAQEKNRMGEVLDARQNWPTSAREK
jgi:hypothetical protein